MDRLQPRGPPVPPARPTRRPVTSLALTRHTHVLHEYPTFDRDVAACADSVASSNTGIGIYNSSTDRHGSPATPDAESLAGPHLELSQAMRDEEALGRGGEQGVVGVTDERMRRWSGDGLVPFPWLRAGACRPESCATSRGLCMSSNRSSTSSATWPSTVTASCPKPNCSTPCGVPLRVRVHAHQPDQERPASRRRQRRTAACHQYHPRNRLPIRHRGHFPDSLTRGGGQSDQQAETATGQGVRIRFIQTAATSPALSGRGDRIRAVPRQDRHLAHAGRQGHRRQPDLGSLDSGAQPPLSLRAL